MIQPVKPTQYFGVVFKADAQEKEPTARCKTCKRWIDKQCQFYNRRTEGNYNRCCNHTNYNPDLTKKYVSPPEYILNEYMPKEVDDLPYPKRTIKK